MNKQIGVTAVLIATSFSFFCASGVYAKTVEANQVATAQLITGVQYPVIVTVGADAVEEARTPLILKSEGAVAGFDKCTFIVDAVAHRATERAHGNLREVACYNSEGVKFSADLVSNASHRYNLIDPSHTIGLRGKLITKQAGLLKGFGKKIEDVGYVQIFAGQKAGIVVQQDVELIAPLSSAQTQKEMKKVVK